MALFFYYLFIFCLVFQPGILWPQLGPYRVVLIIGILCIYFFIIRILQGRVGRLLDPIGKSLIAFIIVQILSNLKVWFHYAVRTSITWSKISTVYFLGVGLLDDISKARKFIWSFILPGLFVGIIGIYNYHFQPDWLYYWEFRTGAYGVYRNPNDLTHLMVLITPFLFKEFESREKVGFRIFLLLSMGITFYASYLAVSRAGLIALMLVFALSIATSKVFKPAFRTALLGAMMVTAAIVLPSKILQRPEYKVYEFARDSSARYSLTYIDDKSSVGRRDAWWMARQLFKKNPLLGVGDDQFDDIYIRDAHSIYFSILAEKGLLGVITFACIILFCFKALLKARVLRSFPRGTPEFEIYLLAQATGITIIGYLTHGLLISKDKEFVFYMCVALCSIIGRLVEKATGEEDRQQEA